MLDQNMHDRFTCLSTADIAGARARLRLSDHHLDATIRPALPFTTMVGSAITVKLKIAKDENSANLTGLREAYWNPVHSYPIIAIQVPGELDGYSIFGDGAATAARKQGFVGALIDGAVRDTPALQKMQFPVFSRLIAPGYIAGKASVASLGKPIAVGGRLIHQGDIILADNDGVIVIRPAEVQAVIEKAEAIVAWEHLTHKALAEGKSPQEVDELQGPCP